MYSLLIALLYLAYIGLGLPSSLIGSAWPAMHNALNVPISYVGVISMVISGGTIVSSLLSDKLTRKLGTRVVTVLSVFITTLTLFGFSFSNTFWMLIVFAIPYGLASGAIDAAVNNYVAVHYESKHLSWLHSFWGVGAIISPFIMSYALTNSTWDKGYLFVTYIQLGISLLLLVTLPVWKVNHREVEISETTKSVGLLDALKIRGVPFLLIGFFLKKNTRINFSWQTVQTTTKCAMQRNWVLTSYPQHYRDILNTQKRMSFRTYRYWPGFVRTILKCF